MALNLITSEDSDIGAKYITTFFKDVTQRQPKCKIIVKPRQCHRKDSTSTFPINQWFDI